MDPTPAESDPLDELAQQSAASIQALRDQLEDSFDNASDSFRALERDLAERMDQSSAAAVEAIVEERVRDESERLAQQAHLLEAERHSFELRRREWQEERSEWESLRDQVEAQLALRERQAADRSIRTGQQASHERDELSAERDALARERDQLLRQRDQLNHANESERRDRQRVECELSDAQRALADAAARLEQAETQRSAPSQTELELQQKCEIAMADLQQHRERAAELEQQLAERPELGAAEAAELISLRNERDELAQKIEDLSRQAPSEPADDSEELVDLRRRFEMAVEDLRELKEEKSRLEEQLAQGGGAAAVPAPVDDGANDWEAQKRRMLAALEGEYEPEDPREAEQRAEERATIEGTIRITDEALAEKDREIARLAAELEEALQQQGAGDEQVRTAILDESEVIQAERKRLSQIEQELLAKLREAELEVSVERAAIARQQSELAAWRQELEAMQTNAPSGKPEDSQGRWFKKLGLNNEQ
ncbi:hypothetical protein Mal64_12160 [Pseudobythopirellula maris]|uniref:Uncharacterized protein n=1 Tax=Pseudobythopirellula maris TaxID=2527991 RepID=A0A5C5ZTL0_9BACT|nr:hypothetical protein [Pseudobythopirellula maris]TWT90819.1 hypothetical protein Mal64_12160 [Pseudobythopirellula maris]